MHIGTVHTAAVFKHGISVQKLEELLATIEVRAVDGSISIPDNLGDEFSSLCDLRLQALMRAKRKIVPSLRIEGGTGWADYARGYYEFAAEFVADKADLDNAEDLLSDSEWLDAFQRMLVAATESFARQYLPTGIFEKYIGSYAVEG
jgi:hypothetical protein